MLEQILEKIDKERIIMFFKNNYLYIICCIFYFLIGWVMLGGRVTSFFLALFLYSISLLVAFSPLGEAIQRLAMGARPLETRKEIEYITPIFEEVYEEARKQYPSLKYIIPYLVDTMAINAFAIGAHTIVFTKGAIESFSESELKGIICHEIAHILHRDTRAQSLIIVGNGIFSVIVIINEWIMSIIERIANLFQRSVNSASGFIGIIALMAKSSFIIGTWFISFAFKAVYSINSRKREFEADAFSINLGYNYGMIDALYLLQKTSLMDNPRIVDKILASHPRISKRIGTLETLSDEAES